MTEVKRPTPLIFALVAGILLSTTPAHAILLRILHTNDLHSYMEHAHTDETGGYAALRAKITRLQNLSKDEGVASLLLDAGDFTEGHPLYFANRGRESWRLMNEMGYDAITIGNHDWMMGNAEVDRIIRDMPLKFQLLGANFSVKSSRISLKKALKPWVLFSKAGLKVAVLGLTTAEQIYDWPSDGIENPRRTARRLLPSIRKDADFVIALTHLGLKKDKRLVRRTHGIDLLIGGHSHTALMTPLHEKNSRQHDVPIVQSGEHGQYLGELVVDLVRGKPLKIIKYELHPILRSEPHDIHIDQLVTRARSLFEEEYGRERLQEVIGFSEVQAPRKSSKKGPWTKLTAEAFERAAHADAGLQITSMTAWNETIGPMTREKILGFMPRMHDVNRRTGWSVWTARVSGELLATLKAANLIGGPYVSFHSDGDDPDIDPEAQYVLAIPEGIQTGLPEYDFLKGLLLKKPKDTGIPIWSALTEEIRRLRFIRDTRSNTN